jgi:hypothetical protein
LKRRIQSLARASIGGSLAFKLILYQPRVLAFKHKPAGALGSALPSRSSMLAHHAGVAHSATMLIKIFAFIAAAIPIALFVRAVFFRRPTRMSEGLKELKKQFDLAFWIFIGLVGCAVAFAMGKLIWTWSGSL